MKILRWIAVPLAAILAWYITFIVGFFAAMMIPCPKGAVVSGACTARWHGITIEVLMVLFSGIVAFLIVKSAAWTAPSHKTQVAWIAYICGVGFAIYILLGVRPSVHMYAAFLVASGAGFVAPWQVARVHGRKNSIQQTHHGAEA